MVLVECLNRLKDDIRGFPRIVANRIDMQDLLLLGVPSDVKDDMARMCVVDAIAHAHATCRSERARACNMQYVQDSIQARIKFYRTISGHLDKTCKEYAPCSRFVFHTLPVPVSVDSTPMDTTGTGTGIPSGPRTPRILIRASSTDMDRTPLVIRNGVIDPDTTPVVRSRRHGDTDFGI